MCGWDVCKRITIRVFRLQRSVEVDQNGKLLFSADSEETDGPLGGLLLTGKYGLRPGQLKFGNDNKFKITTDALVKSYLLVTEFRRNN